MSAGPAFILAQPDAVTISALWGTIGAGGLSLLAFQELRPLVRRVLLVLLSLAALLVVMADGVPAPSVGVMQRTAYACALVAVGWVMAGGWLSLSRPTPRRESLSRAALSVALVLAVIAGTVLVFILCMRVFDAGFEAVTGALSFVPASYGFTREGRTVTALLAICATAALVSTGDRRLPAVLVWLATAAAAWECLLAPVLEVDSIGRLVRTPAAARLMGAVTVVLGLACVAYARMLGRARELWAMATAPDAAAVPGGLGRLDGEVSVWPAYRFSCLVLGLALVVLSAFQVVVPSQLSGSFRLSALFGAVCTLAGAAAIAQVVRRQWHTQLAEASMGLASLGCCLAAALPASAEPTLLVRRFPVVFMAMVAGMAFATLLWTLVAGQLPPPTAGAAEPEHRRQLRIVCKRFAFMTASLGVLAAALLAVWPTRPGVASTEASLDRFAGGLGVHLGLLAVLLFCGQRLRRITFHLLTVLAAGSTLGFAVVRMWPWARTIG